LTVLILATAAGTVQAQTGPAQKRVRPIDRAIRDQRDAKILFQDLVKIMHSVAAELEKTDPASSAIIAAAATKADEALIADDMEKVIALLQTGLVIPADTTQAQVIHRLRQVLETLRGGDDLVSQMIKLEEMRQQLEAVNSLIRRQRALERLSRNLAFGKEVGERLAASREEAVATAKTQRELLGETQKIVFGPVVMQLAGARRAIRAVHRRMEGLAKELGDPFPSPDKMAANIAAAQSMVAEFNAARIRYKTLVNESGLAKVLEQTGAAKEAAETLERLGKAQEELARSARGLEQDQLKEAIVSAGEARLHVNGALAALDRTAGKAGGALPIRELLAEQEALGRKIDPLEAVLAEWTAGEEIEGKVLSKSEKARQWAAAQPRDPAADAGPAERPKPEAASPAMAAAGGLADYDKEAALAGQSALLGQLEDWVKRFDDALFGLESLRKDPNYPRQQNDQEQLTKDIAALARGELPGRSAGEKTAPAPPANEVKVILSKAADFSTSAAAMLHERKAKEANGDQNDVLRALAEAANSLDSEINARMPILTKELRTTALAQLERLIVLEKACHGDTITVWEKRRPDNSFARPELTRIAAVTSLQGQIVSLFDEMVEMLRTARSGHGALIQFPPIMWMLLDMTRPDLVEIKERLQQKDVGPGTQALQKEVIDRFQGMYNAVKPGNDELGKPPEYSAQHVWRDIELTRTDRGAEIMLLMFVQTQVNRRAQELEAMKKSGAPAGVDLAKEFQKIAAQQAQISDAVKKMLSEDMNAER
jgi:hypothetical protein